MHELFPAGWWDCAYDSPQPAPTTLLHSGQSTHCISCQFYVFMRKLVRREEKNKQNKQKQKKYDI